MIGSITIKCDDIAQMLFIETCMNSGQYDHANVNVSGIMIKDMYTTIVWNQIYWYFPLKIVAYYGHIRDQLYYLSYVIIIDVIHTKSSGTNMFMFTKHALFGIIGIRIIFKSYLIFMQIVYML